MEAKSSRRPSGATKAPLEPSEKPLGSRAPEFIKESRALHVTWQILIFVIGLAIVAGGIVLLPLPGPGWLVIFAGIGVWATEFAWAQRFLRWVKHTLREWTVWVKAKRRERARRKADRQRRQECEAADREPDGRS